MRRIESALLAVFCAVGFMACSACGAGTGGTGPGGTNQGTDKAVGRAGQFFLPTGTPRNTANPRVETDAQGNVHMVYPAYSQGDAYYAWCPANCGSADKVKVVQLKTEGTVDNAMLAVGADGRPQLLLSTYKRVYYASCQSGDCTQASSWSVNPILEHDGQREVSGEAFALTPDGKPRFVMHSYRSVGIGSPTPGTFYVQCDADCARPESWTTNQISGRVWQEITLRFNAQGRPRLTKAEIENYGDYMGYYAQCDGDCTVADGWKVAELHKVFFGFSEAVRMYPTLSLALTSKDTPRVLLLGQVNGARNLIYAECDSECTNDQKWSAQYLLNAGSEGEVLRAGLDLALDGEDRPRIVYTASWNILVGSCDSECTNPDKPSWQLGKVEYSGDMQTDKIIPYSNCTMASWFLHSPSLALGKDGLPRVAYRAQDISGGGGKPEPGTTPCSAGADMTFSRFAQLGSLTAK
ncbi:hypothetical protein MEBOL_004902 [Melittangium boletus DSM 14713]|uniref:Lipoprotein n=2 Tax=Melittangium boletus TaxID=83453 RepID=A0A250IHZ3_9BACT|nr:hypothetical protein MEBOL_004902 [Melittangium boletus DSM 14713]